MKRCAPRDPRGNARLLDLSLARSPQAPRATAASKLARVMPDHIFTFWNSGSLKTESLRGSVYNFAWSQELEL
jgi:hypothetical protein